MPAFLSGDKKQINDISMIDDEVDILYGHTLTYLSQISSHALTEAQTKELSDLMAAVNDLESIGDVIETDALALFEQCLEKNIMISEPTQEVLKGIHAKVLEVLKDALQAVTQNNELAAQRAIKSRREFNKLVESAAAHQTERFLADEPERLAHYSVEVEIIEKLKRIYYFAQRIAQTVVPLKIKQRMV